MLFILSISVRLYIPNLWTDTSGFINDCVTTSNNLYTIKFYDVNSITSIKPLLCYKPDLSSYQWVMVDIIHHIHDDNLSPYLEDTDIDTPKDSKLSSLLVFTILLVISITITN